MSSATLPADPVSRLRTYASFVRFEHTLFSLPLILAGIFSAPAPAMPFARWLLVAVAAVGARTAAMSLNRLIDRRLDALNPRTASRELPAGRMQTREAVLLLAASGLAYLLACAMLGPLYLAVAVVPLAVFVAYPYLKRFTPLCHFGVGLALALSPLAGWAVAHPDLAHPGPAIALALFALAWVSGFDIIYATLDEEFDRAHGVNSMVVKFGRARALALSWALHLAAIVALVAVLVLVTRGPIPPERYLWVGVTGALLGITVGLLRMEQKWAEDVNLAFFKVNVWVGAAVLAMVLTARMWAGGF